MTKVLIKGWREGLRKVSMAEMLRQQCGLGLVAAKSVTDRVLAGETVEVYAPTLEDAQRLVDMLRGLGAVAAVEADGERS